LEGLFQHVSGKLRWYFGMQASSESRLMTKQTKITIETDSLLIVRGGNSARAWCPLCQADTELIELDNVGVISNLDRAAVEKWLNSEELHRSQTDAGAPLVCLNSLVARVQDTKTRQPRLPWWRHTLKEIIMKRITIAQAFAIAAITVLALGLAPTANAKGCSNASLKGTFAEQDNGFIPNPPPANPSLFAGVNLDTFDGKGTITATGFGTVDGNGGPQTEIGTYTVNPDCTGTYEVLISPGGFTAHAFFVIADDGNELHIIVTDPGNVITCIARKQSPAAQLEE
jgi:hypothetical protein